ncbi:metalloprotease [Coemansia javaensis]|uniref:Metalloprotease n=1 Tax=Coemansia javaensis TaxID=2761396 RepID=A0A9W8HL19_9FUNG|nr:metalloprotease [Coemansia javaensis]
MGPVFETLERLPSQKDNRFLPPVASLEDGFEARTTGGQGLPYFEFAGDLNKSQSDTREYRLIRLPNGLVAMLVHSADESKACAALDVNVGSLADPPEFQGLAHFCEHLLFMGTKKYPKENDYSEYLSGHGGYSNAYTDLEDTCYYFEVTYDALEGALDRFSQFFIDPLFTADCTEREVRAVDSEHKKNIQSDMWRQYQLEKELSSAAHPFSMFATGNYDTLMGAAKRLGVDLRERLLGFHAQYYSADIMRLVVVGRDPLDQLTEWTVAKFSPILSKGLTKPVFKGHPLTRAETGQLVRFRTVRQQRALDLTFAMPDLKPYYQSKPAQYLGSLLGHEGRGSILAYLKRRGWATGGGGGRAPMSAEGFDTFKITVHLTEPGMAQYEEVVRVVFAYIQLLQARGAQEYFQDELRRISEIEYRFMEKGEAVSLASGLAATMQNRYLPPTHLLSDGVLLTGFDAELVEWVQGFLTPGNVRILLSAHDIAVELLDRKEKYYDIDYRTDPLPAGLMRELEGGGLEHGGGGELQLPEPNAFIPDDLTVKRARVEGAVPAEEPTLLRHGEGMELWFKQDDRFFLPRGNVRVLIETPRAYESPLASVLAQLFTSILKDALAEVTYDADMAGLWFDIREGLDGILVHIDGFNDKLLRLLRLLVEALRTHRVSDTQFEVYSREVHKKLDNARHMEPYSHAQTNTNFLNQSAMWRFADKLEAFEMVTKERLQRFIDGLFEEARVAMLVTGNFGEADALRAADVVTGVLRARALPDYARRLTRSLLHGPGRHMHQAQMPERDNVNSCVDVSVYAGRAADPRERVVLDLVSVVMQEPFFDQLRTKEQLGYIAYSSDRKYNGGQMALRLLVQSEASPLYVGQRIDCFMRAFRARLAEMTQARFEGYVNSLRVGLEEKLKSLYEESSRYWTQITTGRYEFDRTARSLATLATLERADLLAFWDRYANPDSAPGYAALTTAMWSSRIRQPSEAELARFPGPVIALHGCLEHDGVRCLSLDALAALVRDLAAEQPADPCDEDAALERLAAACLAAASSDSSDGADVEAVERALAKIRQPASYVRTALAMARTSWASSSSSSHPLASNGAQTEKEESGANGTAEPEPNGTAEPEPNGTPQPPRGLESIGAVRTPGGVWVFRDAAAFRTTLCQSGAPLPMRRLEPKYTAAEARSAVAAAGAAKGGTTTAAP